MLTFFFPILNYLNDGPFVRRIVVICLRVFAGIAALAGVAAVIGALKLAFSTGAPTSVSFAGILLAALFVGSAAFVAQICLYRGARIAVLEPRQYIFINIAAHLVRMAGEIVAAVMVTLGVSSFVAAVIAGSQMGALEGVLPGPFGQLASGSGFMGLVALIFALLVAFTILVAGYLVAEGLQLYTDVAVDVRSMVTSPFERAYAGNVRPSLSWSVCPNCKTKVEAGNTFCTSCGSPVAQAANA